MIQCLKHKAKERPEKRRGNKVNELRPPHLEQPGQKKNLQNSFSLRSDLRVSLRGYSHSFFLRPWSLGVSNDVFLLENSSIIFHSWKIAPWFPQLIAVIYNSRSAAVPPRRQESAGIDWMDFVHRSAHAAVKSAERKGLVRQRTRARRTANVSNR